MTRRKQEGGNERKQQTKEKKERITKYHRNILPYLDAIKGMMRSGATMEILAEKFDVAVSTLYEYTAKHPEFSDAVKTNAEIADFTIENALYEMAKTDKVAAFFWLKNRQSKRWRDKQHVFQQQTQTIRKDWDNMTDDELEREYKRYEDFNGSDEAEEDNTEGDLH